MTLSLCYSYYSPYQDKLSLILWSRLMYDVILISYHDIISLSANSWFLSYLLSYVLYSYDIRVQYQYVQTVHIRYILYKMGLTAYLSTYLSISLSCSFLSPGSHLSLPAYTYLNHFNLCLQPPEPVYVSLPLDTSSLCVPSLSELYSQ